jgi:hypothetical protein
MQQEMLPGLNRDAQSLLLVWPAAFAPEPSADLARKHPFLHKNARILVFPPLLLEDRYRHRLPVFASSNYRKEALAQRLDRRVMDRLREMCALLEVTGPNLRDRAVQRDQPQTS